MKDELVQNHPMKRIILNVGQYHSDCIMPCAYQKIRPN